MVRDSLTSRLDLGVEDQDEAPGIAQEWTTDDIDDLAYEPGVSLEDRRERLRNLHAELVARQSADMMGDMQEILDIVTDRLASLQNPIEGDTGLDSIGLDPETRRDEDDPAEYVDEDVFAHDLTGAPITAEGEDVVLDSNEDEVEDQDIDHNVEQEEIEAREDSNASSRRKRKSRTAFLT